ncbi:MAG TPA: alpha/beta hydrolase, partial [Micrococcaceae bacterium]|nr:alpha/beta hydrolase [Micrococcaceae bacterium]
MFPLGALATAGAAITTGSALFTLHPAYPLLLGIVFALSGLLAWRFWRQPVNTPRRFNFLRALGLLASCAVYALVWWLAPFTAVGPALAAMHSDTTVNVTERANQIVLAPSGATSEVGVFFQPGARVDARAYAAVLRPLAENGHTVVIAKQPLGIAFLASGAFETARTDNPVVDRWVLGGHSLGGVLSSSTAQELSTNADQDLAGLLLFASYPATDLSGLDLAVLSISGSNDG